MPQRVSTVEHELYFLDTELMHIQFFYSTSHFTQLLHHALIPIFLITTLIPIHQCYDYFPLYTQGGITLEADINLRRTEIHGLNYSFQLQHPEFFKCIMSMNLSVHRTSDYTGISHVFRPGNKPESTAWKSRALTAQPATQFMIS